MKLYNLMEGEVISNIDVVFANMKDICKCDICKMDIAAIALNHLKPKYVVTDEGYVYAKAGNMSYQFNSDIIAEITKAIDIVSKNPRHNK